MLEIPNNKLNGYNIIAQAPVFRPNGQRENEEYVILGHDPSRKYPKYVTALTSQAIIDESREWYWGHYFEGTPTALTEALENFVKRMQIPPRPAALTEAEQKIADSYAASQER